LKSTVSNNFKKKKVINYTYKNNINVKSKNKTSKKSQLFEYSMSTLHYHNTLKYSLLGQVKV